MSVGFTWYEVNLSLPMIMYLLVQQRNCLLATILILERKDRGEYLDESSGKGERKNFQTYVSYIKMLSTVVLTDSADMVGHLVQLRIRSLI